MQTEMDLTGLRCPHPVMRIAAASTVMKAGDSLLATGDCPTFEDDLKKWAARSKRTAIMHGRQGDAITFLIRY